MWSVDQNRATYLGGLKVFESTCCTVEVSTWDRGGPPCTERVLCILEDRGDCCGKDFTLLMAFTFLIVSGDGVIPLT